MTMKTICSALKTPGSTESVKVMVCVSKVLARLSCEHYIRNTFSYVTCIFFNIMKPNAPQTSADQASTTVVSQA